MEVRKFVADVVSLQFFPKLPYAEAVTKDFGVVKKDNPTDRKLGYPSFKIAFDGLIGVKPINMKKVDCMILKQMHSFIKILPDYLYRGELSSPLLDEFIVNLGIKDTRMLIPHPQINTYNLSLEPESFHSLSRAK